MLEDRRADSRPGIEPGQIWVIEQNPAPVWSALDGSALASADVVLYERALARLMPDLLSPGGYAEPLAADADAGDPALSPRAVKLAGDGWRVVQLVRPCRDRRQRLRRSAAALAGPNGAGGPAIRLIAKTTGAEGCSRASRGTELAALVDGLAEDALLTLILGPLAGSIPAAAWGFAGNGLAG
jgi:hypothetical protein